ncbi:uncharacterized protein KY384_000218 [Bacidia gigantensis]|uniref:uncharacterized protein n=1 Tax=Bacidia gigantensis TaxID=2732470 RepID=UPI001D057A13|nr:uncharacterized protein KY384_000218 [Bacidia gigantensis]KAG8526225.1 hypothetical protein KY384_000218 [Bacidia gigantensis]
MSSAQPPNVAPHSESKSAKKKKAKAEAAAQSPTVAEPDTGDASAGAENATNGTDAYESPFVKDLAKNIRNIKKKLNATQKVDSIVAENPGTSLDELLASKKINSDQKIQAQKKPGLQTQLAQYEEQISQFKQLDEDFKKRLKEEKSAWETSSDDKAQKVKEAAVEAAVADGRKEAKENLLVLSKFLRAAAAKRQGGDETSPENRAFEGALLLVYGGEASAVEAMENLVAGKDEKVPTVDSTPSEYTFQQVRDLSFSYAPYSAEEAWAEEVAQSSPTAPTATLDDEPKAAEIGTDPTVAHAGLTEFETTDGPPPSYQTNGVSSPNENAHDAPSASGIGADAANKAGGGEETSGEGGGGDWEAKVSTRGGGGGDDWVQVPRDPAETDTGTDGTLTGTGGTQSWAEDVPLAAPEADTDVMGTPAYAQGGTGAGAKEGATGDGFSEVQRHHHRGSRSRGGNERGDRRGRGGGYRGDREGGRGRGGGGFRGDGERGARGRGRGRGDYRGRGGRGGGGAGGASAGGGGGET